MMGAVVLNNLYYVSIEQNERLAKLVELRIFGGLEVLEIADVLDISRATVHRDWSRARAWLARELRR